MLNKILKFDYYNLNKIITFKILLVYIINNIQKLKTSFYYNINYFFN